MGDYKYAIEVGNKKGFFNNFPNPKLFVTRNKAINYAKKKYDNGHAVAVNKIIKGRIKTIIIKGSKDKHPITKNRGSLNIKKNYKRKPSKR